MDRDGAAAARAHGDRVQAQHDRAICPQQRHVGPELVVVPGKPAAVDLAPAALDHHHFAQRRRLVAALERAAAPLVARVDDRAALALHLLARPRVRVAGPGRKVGAVGRFRDLDRAVDRAASGIVPLQRPGARKARRPHRRRPRSPLRGRHGELARQLGHRLVHRMAGIGRARGGRAEAAEPLCVGKRVIAPVHGHEEIPLLLRPALDHDASHRVAAAAHAIDVLIPLMRLLV